MRDPKPCYGYPSQRAAAKALGVSDVTLIRHLRRHGTIEGIGQQDRPALTDETREAILSAWRRGLTSGQIGLKLGISPHSVLGVVRRAKKHERKNNV